jgi:hypothetical protein
MANRIQDLEQEVLLCWQIIEDLKTLAEEHETENEVCDQILAIATVYEMRFNKAWKTYEYAVDEYYENRDLIKTFHEPERR